MKQQLGVKQTCDWLKGYYQHADRVAILSSLITSHGVAARLVCTYFTGEKHPKIVGPVDAAAWQPALLRMNAHLGLTGAHPLSARIRDVFLAVG